MVVFCQILKLIRSGEEIVWEVIGDGWCKEMLGVYFIEWLVIVKEMDVCLYDDWIEFWLC